MSFRFSMQKILELRIIEEENAQKEVNLTKKNILQLKKILEEERLLYFSERDELNESVKKIEFTQIKIYEKSLAIRQNKMMDILKNIREMQFDLKDQENILIQAKLNKKMIEKLYDIREKEYQKKEIMKEQYLLDELASIAYLKNQVGEENEE